MAASFRPEPLQTNTAGRQPVNNRPPAGVTEIVLSDSEHSLVMVLPMLAHLSQNAGSRWLTWITPTPPPKALLLRYGFDLSRVQIIYPASDDDAKWMFWEALNNGTSATVVAGLSSVGKEELKNLEMASSHGNCRGLLLRLR